jgi:nucleoid-associated protein YgaU
VVLRLYLRWMPVIGPHIRVASFRWVAGIVGVAGVSLVGYFFLHEPGASPAVPVAATIEPAAPSAVQSVIRGDGVPAGPMAPSFDVVRVAPTGNAVIAGRAEPGAEVVVRDGEREVARALADRHGEFVALPTAPLRPGGSALTLAARSGAGAEVKGDGSVVVIVPPAAEVSGSTGAVAVLAPAAGPPRVLQDGGRRESGAILSLDIVDYDDTGAIRFTGMAAAGGTVRVYVDNAPVGDQQADAAGRWSLTPKEGVGPGLHTVRVDQIDAGGRVTGRVETPFQRAILAQSVPGVDRVVVQPGQTLWRLARAAYGRGIQYSMIYVANRDQIKDPNRIYPGQTFAVPAR